jgi:methylphosphotriester-DNA--protein-cysteine methyltransferase
MPSLPSERVMRRAFLAGDASYDGVFFTGVKTTGIFCRPSCTARKPRPENVEFFATPREAMFSGYRACKRCPTPGCSSNWRTVSMPRSMEPKLQQPFRGGPTNEKTAQLRSIADGAV